MGEPRSFRNSTRSRVENQLKTIELTARKIEEERVAIVYLGMNERCSDSFSCNGIESTSDTTKVTNSHKARFRHRRNMIRHGEIRVEYDTKVTSRVRRSNRNTGRHAKSSVRDFRKLFGKTNK